MTTQPNPAPEPVRMLCCIGRSNKIQLNRIYEMHNRGDAESYAHVSDMELIEVEIRPISSLEDEKRELDYLCVAKSHRDALMEENYKLQSRCEDLSKEIERLQNDLIGKQPFTAGALYYNRELVKSLESQLKTAREHVFSAINYLDDIEDRSHLYKIEKAVEELRKIEMFISEDRQKGGEQ